MSMLAKDKELRKRMGEEGYIESQKYSDRNYYNDFVDISKKLKYNNYILLSSEDEYNDCNFVNLKYHYR